MYRNSLVISFVVIINILAFSSKGQGQTFLFGQLVTNAFALKMPEIIQLKALEPILTLCFDRQAVGTSAKTWTTATSSKLMISSVAPELQPRNLSASITSGILPDNLVLKLSVQDPNDNFKGYHGTIGSEIALNKADRTIITEIGTCYSGKTDSDGYSVKYACEMPIKPGTFSSIKHKSVTVTLTVAAEV
jgi:hypothetical protein